MLIDTVAKLKFHLKIIKKKLLDSGCGEFELYPAFCVYYVNNKDKFALSEVQVLNMACEILIEGE